jgi:hypothetical protein
MWDERSPERIRNPGCRHTSRPSSRSATASGGTWPTEGQDVASATREAKENSWAEFVGELENSTDTSKAWKVIRSLSGTPTSSSPNEALTHNGKSVVTDQKKADVFVDHYAKVSRLTFSKEERRRNREVRRALKAASVSDESSRDFSMAELKTAIKKIRGKGAEGPDEIPPPRSSKHWDLSPEKSYLKFSTSPGRPDTARRSGRTRPSSLF